MEREPPVSFGPFRLHAQQGRLWRDDEEIQLGATALGLLSYLVRNSGRLITKAELLEAVWPDAHVTTTVLKVHVHAIRQALQDQAETPRYIETVPRVGYRFVGRGDGGQAEVGAVVPRLRGRPIVAREQELERLRAWLDEARRGERRLVFVTGEPGIGKTAVVDLFLKTIEGSRHVAIGRGQCVEQYGEGEAYLPVLEALAELCREAGGGQIAHLLRQHAPTWLAQMPALLDQTNLEGLRRRAEGVTPERMMREMAEALETLAAVRPLVLVFEDLHWSDRSTLELVAYLAQRRQRARLLVIGTYRPTAVVLSGHPLKGIKQELHARGHCDELAVELLAPPGVKVYLAGRLGNTGLTDELAGVIHRRTEGHPLFMVNVVEYCLLRGSLRETDGVWTLQDGDDAAVPESVRQMIEKQIELLDEKTQRLLEVASVGGGEFAVASVAAAAKRDLEEVEETCEELALRGHLLREGGFVEWPDGTVSGRYTFRHALYQNVLYERVAEARRVRLHRAIGEREEAAHGADTARVAAALAMHFERGRDWERTVKYLQQAGESADRRNAHHEAIKHFTRAIERLRTLPETPARTRQELALQLSLGGPLMVIKFFAAPEMEAVCARAREVVDASRDAPDLVPALQFLRGFHFMRAELAAARGLAERLLAIAERTQDPFTLLWSRYSLGETLLFMGEPRSALAHLEQGIALRDAQPAGWRAVNIHHPAVACLAHAGLAEWLLGHPDRGLARMREAIELAQQMAHPLSQAFALGMAGTSHLVRGEAEAAAERADEVIDLATTHGLRYWLAMATGTRGLALDLKGTSEGMQIATQGYVDYRATGARINGTFGAMFVAQSSLRRGGSSPDLGFAFLSEALATVESTGERLWEAELHRLRGELLRRVAEGKGEKATSEAEGSLLHGLEIARRQEAKILELRAAMSLSRLWRRRGKRKAARDILGEAYGWFGEGFDVHDLRAARMLLAELA